MEVRRIITKIATSTVDPNSNGVLDQAGDVAVVDVREICKLTAYVDHVSDTLALIGRAHATLDLATKTTHCNTVIEDAAAGVGGNSTTIAFVPGDTLNAGHLDESAYPTVVFHYKTAVTTVANFETAIAGSVHLAVLTPGTGANVLADPADTFTATNLAGGTSTEGAFHLTIEKSVDETNYALVRTLDQTNFGDGANKSFEIPLVDANGMSLNLKSVKVTLDSLEDANSFTMHVCGELRE
jgi:hypothetical protein